MWCTWLYVLVVYVVHMIWLYVLVVYVVYMIPWVSGVCGVYGCMG